MNKTLRIEIECGDETCASMPGKWCRFLGARGFGTTPLCMLFPDPFPAPHNVGGRTKLEIKNGWIQRCSDCLAAEGGMSETAETVKLRATMTWTLEVKREWYKSGMTPEEIAVIESEADIESALIIGIERPDFLFTVKVKEGE